MNNRSCYILFLFALSFQFGFGQVDFKADVVEGCAPFKVKFTIDSSSIDVSRIKYLTWHFDQGDTINSLDPDTVIYQREGKFTIRLVMNGQRDSAVVKQDYIIAHKTVYSAFEWEEIGDNYQYRFIPVDHITDSSNTYIYTWRYFDSIPDLINVSDYVIKLEDQQRAIDTFSFEEPGRYLIALRIEDLSGCITQHRREIIIADEVEIANVFVTGLQDFYIIDPEDASINLEFTVFSRTGSLVFFQSAPIINWDGRTNSGLDISNGVYYYILQSTTGDPLKRYSKKGFIHLFHQN